MPENQRYAVARTEELPPGTKKIVQINNRSIGVFNVNGNLCPHELAPVCKGRVSGTTLPSQPGEYRWAHEGEILYCPWHGWEFNLLTGDCLTDKRRLFHYPVEIEDGTIYIIWKGKN
jgi:nitrite reductase (NADH) small subunit